MTSEKADAEMAEIAEEALEFVIGHWNRESLRTLYRVLHAAALPDPKVMVLQPTPREEADGHGGIPTGGLSRSERRMGTELRDYLRREHPDKSVELLYAALHQAAAMLVAEHSPDEE